MNEVVSEKLPKGWVRDESGALRRETIHSMLRRLPGWDYCQPWIYQITFVCADRRAAPLGRVVVRKKGDTAWLTLPEARRMKILPEEIEAKVDRSPLGEAVFGLFRRFPEFTPEIKPLQCEVMPDHLHFIVHVVREMKRPLGNAVGGFKTGCEKLYRAAGGEGRLFAAGFQDTILFHAGQLGNMFRYLGDNARRRAIKALYPDLFRVVDEIAVSLRLSPRERDETLRLSPRERDETLRLSPRERDETLRLSPRERDERAALGEASSVATARGWFSALGNRFLLDRPLVQVQVSRSDFGYRREPKADGSGLKIVCDARSEPVVEFATPLYEEKKTALMAAARHGAVLVSPCVSDGERQIAREALAADLSLVALRNKGFSKLQKPSGRHFDACAVGRLLLLAPAAWPYQPGEKPMTRADATAMNRLCQWIVGEDAAEINYHGMLPENVDGLASAAARVEKI